jgi:hypothetical protein
MSATRSLLSCLGLVALAGFLQAEPPLPLDLIPEEAAVGMGTRNLAELRTKGDRLVAKMGKANAPRGVSAFLDMISRELKLEWKVDEKKPAAIVALTGALGGFPGDADFGRNILTGVVLAPQSLAEVARVYKMPVEELKKGEVRKVPGHKPDPEFGTDHAGFRDGQIYLTGNEKATAAWMTARTLRQGQPAARRRRLDATDGLVYFGTPFFQIDRQRRAQQLEKPGSGSAEEEARRRLLRLSLEVRNVLAAFRLDDGLGLDLSVGFDPKGTHSQAMLKAVRGTGRSSNLAGLPESERLVGAVAAVGLEQKDLLPLARALASSLASLPKGTIPLLDSDEALVPRIFGELCGRLRLARLALYQGSDPGRVGQLAAVAVLEPDNTEGFTKDIAGSARPGVVELLEPKAAPSKARIEKLIGELGAEDFQARQAATTQLRQIGEAALPYLEKAEKSTDAEVRRRAGELVRTLRSAADLRKQELARGLLGKDFRPTFTLQLNAEKRAGTDVHLLGMRFESKEAPYAVALEDLFGPQWNRLRLAAVGKQVVVLLGSDLDLLDRALANVRDGKPGLEQSAALAEFHKQAAPERCLELHLALDRVRALFTLAAELPADFKAGGACSSISLRAGSADLGVDLWIPADVVPDVARLLRMW